MIEWLSGIAATLLSLILGWLMMAIKRAHARIDELEKSSMTKAEITEKINDKLDSIKVQHVELKEDIKEIKEILSRLR